MPWLEELHINHSSVLERKILQEPLTTVLFPQLLHLYISGQNPGNLSFNDELARVALNLTHLRFSVSHFRQVSHYCRF